MFQAGRMAQAGEVPFHAQIAAWNPVFSGKSGFEGA